MRPIKVPADNEKAEGLVAELAALRVSEKSDTSAFVADDVTDLAKYGLDTPSMTLTVTPFKNGGEPQTLQIGKAVAADKPDEVYAMRGDQNDVVRVDSKRLREAIPGVNIRWLRSQTVLDFDPPRLDHLKIDTSAARIYDLCANAFRLVSRKPRQGHGRECGGPDAPGATG